MLAAVMKSLYLNVFIVLMLSAYITWSIWKNFKYVKKVSGLFYLPLLQFTSDIAVITGTSLGIIQKISLENLIKLTKGNKGIFLILLIYVVTMLFLIKWGVPNISHPFNYAMDEWHFSQALRAFFNHGTG